METRIIIRPDMNEIKKIIELRDSINTELIIIPKDIQILIKDREGFWSVVE